MNRYLKIFNNLILLSKKNKSRRNYKISIYLIKKKNKIIKNVEISKKLKNLFKNFLHLIEEFLKNHNSKYWIKYLEKIVKVELNFNLNIELILEEIDKNELSRNLKSIMKVIKRIKYKKNRIENICYDHESNNYIYSRRKFTVKSLKKNFFEKNKKIKKDVSKFILFDLLNKIYLKDGRFISNLNQNQFLIKPMKDQSVKYIFLCKTFKNIFS